MDLSDAKMIQDRQLFTLQDLARRWGCSQQTVRMMCKKGQLKHFRVGNRYKINAEAVWEFEQWQNTQSSSSTEESGVSNLERPKSSAEKSAPPANVSHSEPPTVLWRSVG